MKKNKKILFITVFISILLLIIAYLPYDVMSISAKVHSLIHGLPVECKSLIGEGEFPLTVVATGVRGGRCRLYSIYKRETTRVIIQKNSDWLTKLPKEKLFDFETNCGTARGYYFNLPGQSFYEIELLEKSLFLRFYKVNPCQIEFYLNFFLATCDSWSN
jgi:hypothetical protein